MNDDDVIGLVVFMGCVVIILIVMLVELKTWNGDITSGKQFILNNATYVCKKTNELKEE